MNFLFDFLLELQEITILVARAVRGLFKRPFYAVETIKQMDVIGVDSLTIILLTGFFTGGVLTLQTYPTLAFYGAQSETGYLVAYSLIRELGPVLTALSQEESVRQFPPNSARWLFPNKLRRCGL